MSKTRWAFMMVGSHLEFLWTRAVIFIVSNMSSPLLLAAPSVPRPTGTPASHISGTGAVPPLASFMFDTGQWATLTPLLPNSLTSLLVNQTEWAARTRLLRKPILSRYSATRPFPSFSNWACSPRVSAM